MDTIHRLQNWYCNQCDGDWEHGMGIKIDTMDNPGWSVVIDLEDTHLEDVHFPEKAYDFSTHDWIKCWKDGNKFRIFCGLFKLDEVLTHFLDWAEAHANPT